jgi:phage/plasmid-associated DNA primase
MARLPGVRMTCTGEIGQGRRLDEAKVKDMTGGDMIAARFMRAEFFDFTPVFKLWLYGNHKPRITGDDHGIWRRVRLIPFVATIGEGEKDPNLPDRLAAELPGILAWAVRGCLDWQREGLGTPEAVTRATERYRAEQDTVGAFMAERCELHPQAWVKARELYQAYQRWAEGGGERPLSIREFDAKLDARGYPSTRRSSGNIRRGIGLIDPNDLPLDDDPPPPAPPAPTPPPPTPPTPPTRAEVARGGDPPPAPEAGRIALINWANDRVKPHGGRAELGEGSTYVVTSLTGNRRTLASREELITYVTTLPRV